MGNVKMPACLFCDVVNDKDDEKNLVLERGENWYIIINRYPYTTGHIMVVCSRHANGVSDLDEAERREMTKMLSRCEQALSASYHPQGINVGANLGDCAGAGVPGHLHFHLVPRWQGDTSFLTTIGDTRVVSEDLKDTYERIRAALAQL